MKVYERILSILEEKGPMPITDLCRELNHIQDLEMASPFLPSQIQSVISRKKDLFHNHNEQISILPEKYPEFLKAYVGGFSGPCYQVRVNFLQKRFTYLVWTRNRDGEINMENLYQSKLPGDFEEFKRDILSMKLWEWESSYPTNEGIILDGTNWFVELKTTKTVYKSEGMQAFPPKWKKFCRAIEKLTASPFH